MERNPLSQHPALLWSLFPISLVQEDCLLLLCPHSQPPHCMLQSVFVLKFSLDFKNELFFKLHVFIALQLRVSHMVVGHFSIIQFQCLCQELVLIKDWL